jgi:hypothetical protein
MSVVVNDEMGESGTSKYVTVSSSEQTIDYGKAGSFTYTAANVPTTGALVRFKVGYQVLDESGAPMADGKIFYAESYAWLNYNPTNEAEYKNSTSEQQDNGIYTPHYIGLSNAKVNIENLTTSRTERDAGASGSKQTHKIESLSGKQDGITFGKVEYSLDKNDHTFTFQNFVTSTKEYEYTPLNWIGSAQDPKKISITVSGSVNEAEWKAANKTPGSSTNFNIRVYNKDGSNDHTLSLIYYDDVYQGKLAQLAANEMDALRLAADYNLTGTVYANGILTSANSTDEDGEVIYRESNFKDLVWIDDDENEYAANLVTDIVETTDEKGNVIAATGKVGNVSVNKVTKIDCATAINNYVAAFVPGIRGGQQAFNAEMVFDVQARYEALYVASKDVGCCKKLQNRSLQKVTAIISTKLLMILK